MAKAMTRRTLAGWAGKVAGTLALALMASTAAAQGSFAPAIVFDMGGKFDKSFNEAAYTGAEKFKTETGVAYREVEITNESQREQALRNLARRNVSIIVAVGFSQRSAVEKVAPEFPNVKFTLIDDKVDGPNVQSILFKEEEGSYLVGMAAAMAAKSGKIGFIGGMDIPLIRAFGCGYLQGARAVTPGIELVQNMTGTTPTAWRDPTRGGELARSQFDRGVEVVFAAAGGTGLGVFQAAKDRGKLGIGVDSNQNSVQPGTILTSMVKRVDNAVYNAFKEAQSGSWKAGLTVMGLKEDGVGWALDKDNRSLVPAAMEQRVEAAKADIIAGKIKVVDYRQGNSCPVQ